MIGWGDMQLPGWMAVGLLAYIRVQATLLTMPGWGERLVPARIRIGLAMAMTPLMTELMPDPLADGVGGGYPNGLHLGVAAGVELVIGLVMGLFVRIAGYALGMAASAIAATTSLSQLLGGPSEAAPHPLGNILDLAGFALLMALGYPIFLVDYMVTGYAILPVGQLPDSQLLGLAGVTAVARSFGLAMMLASPFILGSFLYQCLQGVVSRVMPQLPIVFIGAPAALTLALSGVALFAVLILGIWADSVLGLRLPELRP